MDKSLDESLDESFAKFVESISEGSQSTTVQGVPDVDHNEIDIETIANANTEDDTTYDFFSYQRVFLLEWGF